MEPESGEETVVSVRKNLKQFKVMDFNLHNVTVTFKRLMDRILSASLSWHVDRHDTLVNVKAFEQE